MQFLILLATDQAGQDLIEYALVVAMLGLAAIAGLRSVTTAIVTVFNSLNSALAGAF
jgi:pilus assembly protein Flp/PilA